MRAIIVLMMLGAMLLCGCNASKLQQAEAPVSLELRGN